MDSSTDTVTYTLATLLAARRTVRSFDRRPLARKQVDEILWSGQGSVHPDHRTVPSAGGRYPISLTLVVGTVEGLKAGAYRHHPADATLTAVDDRDLRPHLAGAAIGPQPWLAEAPAVIVIGANVAASLDHFASQQPDGRRGLRYACVEVGAAAQNIALQATARGLGTVLVGGFDDEKLSNLRPAVAPDGIEPLALIAVGHPRTDS